MSRTGKSVKNIRYALLGEALILLVNFLSRRVFAFVLSTEYLGLNGTFSNILSMLSLAELGIGSAITFSMYKPLAEGDEIKIKALVELYRKAYNIIGVFVLAAGSLVTPFLPYLIKDMPDIPHLSAIYLMYVALSAASYFCAYKRSLVIADQKQYLVTAYHSACRIIMNILQILLLLWTGSYFLYLGAQIVMTVAENIALSLRADRLYPFLKTTEKTALDKETTRTLVRNVKAMVLHKLGTVVVNGTDNLLITYFVGLVAAGLYSNYYLVTSALSTVYSLVFSAVTASVGNLGAEKGGRNALEAFDRINFFGSWLYGFSAICLFVLINPFISDIWLTDEYVFNMPLVLIIAANFYLTGMRRAGLTFRDAFGLYYYDRYKPVAESVINLVASILLAKRYGVAGVFLGTLISTITTCFWIEPYVLYKHGFQTSVWPYFVKYGINTLITAAAGILTWWVCGFLPQAGFLPFVARAAICLILPNVIFLLAYGRTACFRYYMGLLKKIVKHTV